MASKLSVDGINDGGEVSREERLKMVMEKSLVMEEKLREKMERRGDPLGVPRGWCNAESDYFGPINLLFLLTEKWNAREEKALPLHNKEKH